MINDNLLSLPPTSVTSFLLKIAVYEEKIVVLDSIFTEEESVNCLMEDKEALFEQMRILSEGIRRGEKQFSFEFRSELRNRWFMIKANYTDTLVDIKYPVFELLVTDITYVKHPMAKDLMRRMESASLVEDVYCGIVKIKLDEGYSIEWANTYFTKHIGNVKFLTSCIVNEDKRKFQNMLENDMTCNTYSKKIRLSSTAGEVNWYDVRIETKTVADEMENSCYCIFSDVTDEVIREQELKTFQERYKMVLSITSELVFEYDVKHDSMYYFDRGENTLKRPNKIANFSKCILEKGMNGGELTKESRNVVRSVQQRIRQNKCSLEEAYIAYEHEDGHKQWLYVVGKYLYDGNGGIELVIGKISDVTDHKQTEERLLMKARTDALTQINNREYAKEEIAKYLADNAAGYLPSLLILDIDNFKWINDSYGHGEGDTVLVNLANILVKEFRSTDIIGRLGGDEFIVFLKNVKSPSIVYEKAKAICARVKENFDYISVSVGISIMTEEQATFESLYKTADIALYQAKVSGKNTYISYNDLSDEVKKKALTKSIRLNNSGRNEFEDMSIEANSMNFLGQILDGYQYIYSLNLTEDKIRRFYKSSERYKETEYASYSNVCEHIRKSIPTAEEQEEFDRVFALDNLLLTLKSGKKKQIQFLRLSNRKHEYRWYQVEIINQYDGKGTNIRGTFLANEIQEEKIIELRGLKGSNQESIGNKQVEQVYEDELTGLYREQRFYYEVRKKLTEEENKKYAIIAFDVDCFRVFNDIYNESISNKILCRIADVLRTIEVSDKIYSRYCADRFTVFMSYSERGDILNVIEKIRRDCVSMPWVKAELKLSFGVYQLGDTSIPVRLMCDWARLAEYTVKGLCMQYYAFYNEEYRNKIVERQLIENEMGNALANNQFLMYLQPKYNLETNCVIGAEALVRWKHPVKGMISPDKFIPLFEKNGFIIQLDEYIWEEACKQIRKWLDQDKEIPISVNISRIHTYDTNFVNKLVELVEKYDIPVYLLQLEFTESMFMEHEQALYSLMQRLKEQGFTLLMDDFGSGYSSLNMLKNVPIDIIKLDRIFFQDIMVNSRGKVIIESSIRMIHDLKLDVTAEGIEKKEHIDFLNKCHCNTGQGFFYSKPMDVGEFEQLCLM